MTGTPGQQAGSYLLVVLAPFVAVLVYEAVAWLLERLPGERCTCCRQWTLTTKSERVGLCEDCIEDGAHYLTTIDPRTGEMEG